MICRRGRTSEPGNPPHQADERSRRPYLALALSLVTLALVRRRRKGHVPIAEGPAIDLSLPAADTAVIEGADGAEISTVTLGKADGPTAVLVHCWMGDRSLWAPVANALVDDGWRVVLYDQRGHGSSTLGVAAPAVEQLGEDLHLVLDALDLENVILAGHSMGGMAIQALLSGHPGDLDRVAGIALVATSSRSSRRAIPAGLANLVIGSRADRRLQRQSAGQFGRAFGPAASPAQVQAVHDLVRSTAPEVRSGFLSAMSRMDNRDRLPRVDAPVRILVGDTDRLTPVAHARVLAAALGDVPVNILEGKGHMLPLEAPEEIVATITALRGDASSSTGSTTSSPTNAATSRS